ncbi:DUF6049 family protein [Cellulomonas fengjieae]|uniref:Secreted protein n=1 Tax=Cellulomonas fengjieae TaxID=2819978 RepID=A0ABS3SK99_9CELL|nr:DUF6049 family protein [Cellulomonas fengjieae]MBO3085400.1 hypothetical protein [Cellulomonas fengjieae]QVI66048.1 hypothetical protein KG102_18590 [Cellulomonas fengjieae]
MSAGSLRRRVLGAALAVVGALALAAPVAGPAVAATEQPELAVSVQVTEVSPSILRPGEDLRVRATLRNDSDEAIAQPSAALRISRFRISSRAEVDAWATAGTTGLSRTSRVAAAPVAEPLLPGASVAVELVVPAADVRLLDGADTWGPRGLVVEVLDGTSRVGLQRTFLLWLTTDDVPRTQLSLLVPVVGPPTAPADADPATASALDDQVAPGGRLRDLSSVIAASPNIGVAVDPALLADASAGGEEARSWAAELTDELAGHDAIALPWSDPDIAAAAHAGHPDLVRLAADRTAQAGIPALTAAGLLWAPGTDLPDQSTAAVTAQVGAGVLVLPPVAPDDGDTPGAAVRVQTTAGPVNALAPDATLTQLLTAPRAVDEGATTTTTVQRALTELAVISRESDDPPHLLVAPGRDWEPDVATVTALTNAFSAAPWVRVAPVSALVESPSPDARVTLPSRAVSDDELAPSDVGALADARTRAVAFAGVTSEPATLLDGVDTEVLDPLSVAWRAEPERRAALVAEVVADIDARTTGLSIADLSDVRVVAADSALPIVVRNQLAVPATVLLDVTPRTACLEVGEVEPVVLDARSEKSVRIPMHARANCTVTVSAQLTAPDGLAVSPPVEFTAQVAPTIESIGTVVIGVLLALGLVLGIVRTVRRGQSARRGARIAAEADAPTSLPVLGGAPDDDATGQAR